jgi:hypothetical protein
VVRISNTVRVQISNADGVPEAHDPIKGASAGGEEPFSNQAPGAAAAPSPSPSAQLLSQGGGALESNQQTPSQHDAPTDADSSTEADDETTATEYQDFSSSAAAAAAAAGDDDEVGHA